MMKHRHNRHIRVQLVLMALLVQVVAILVQLVLMALLVPPV